MNLANLAGPPATSIARLNAASLSFAAIAEVKHCFGPEVKHCLMCDRTANGDNQAMIDATELARRLRIAMDDRKAPVKSATLAAACGVSAQAVVGWRKTGRIAKRHLPKISELTERPLAWFLGSSTPANSLEIIEGEAISRLRHALPEWRRYVLDLAMLDIAQQETFLRVMQPPASDFKVERAYGTAPHVAARKTTSKS